MKENDMGRAYGTCGEENAFRGEGIRRRTLGKPRRRRKDNIKIVLK
jgi:hypothetical protein